MEKLGNIISEDQKNKLNSFKRDLEHTSNFVGEEAGSSSNFLDGLFAPPNPDDEKKQFSETKVGSFLDKNKGTIGGILGGILGGSPTGSGGGTPPPPTEKKDNTMTYVIIGLLLLVIIVVLVLVLRKK